MRHANGNAHIHSDSDSDGNCHIHSDGDSDSNATYADGDSNSYAYTDSYTTAQRHLLQRYSDGYSHSNRNARIPAAFTDAAASADTAASPLALLRNQGLVRTNSRVPSLSWIRPAGAGR